MSQQPDMSQAIVASPSPVYDPLWYPDSGASHHLTPDSSNFSTKSTYDGGDRVQIGNGLGMSIMHVGQSNLFSKSSNTTFALKTLFHVPGLTKNLLSVSQFGKDHNVLFEFTADSCCVKSQVTKESLLQGTIKDGLYVFPDLRSSAISQIALVLFHIMLHLLHLL